MYRGKPIYHYHYTENPLFVANQFNIVSFLSFEISGLGSENIYPQSQHVKMIFADCI